MKMRVNWLCSVRKVDLESSSKFNLLLKLCPLSMEDLYREFTEGWSDGYSEKKLGLKKLIM
jgi:hypothetical protein